MTQEERNRLSLQRITESATREFARYGYAGASINNICNNGGISKGNLYHYFKDKDSVYLSCLKLCLDGLVDRLKTIDKQQDALLEAYFRVRMDYFMEHPDYQKLFNDAVATPPPHLKERIAALKEELDQLNLELITEVLKKEKLRSCFPLEQTVHIYRFYQDFANQIILASRNEESMDIKERTELSKQMVQLFLYGIVERDNSHCV